MKTIAAIIVWLSLTGVSTFIEVKTEQKIREIVRSEIAPLKTAIEDNKCPCDNR